MWHNNVQNIEKYFHQLNWLKTFIFIRKVLTQQQKFFWSISCRDLVSQDRISQDRNQHFSQDPNYFSQDRNYFSQDRNYFSQDRNYFFTRTKD
jgi:hypothetical protein